MHKFQADLSEEQLSEAREVFTYFDTKGDERIYINQTADVLRALGQNPTQTEIKKCCDRWSDPGMHLIRPIIHIQFIF